MGIYDRDYMRRTPPPPNAPKPRENRRDDSKPSFWQRLRFQLWLLVNKKKL